MWHLETSLAAIRQLQTTIAEAHATHVVPLKGMARHETLVEEAMQIRIS